MSSLALCPATIDWYAISHRTPDLQYQETSAVHQHHSRGDGRSRKKRSARGHDPGFGDAYYRRGNMHRRNQDHALAHSAFFESGRHLWSDVDVLPMFLGIEGQVFCVK